MKFNHSKMSKRWIAYTLAACTTVLFYLVLSHLGTIWGVIKAFFGFLSPVIVGIVIAYVMDPLTKWFEKTVFHRVKSRHMRRNLSILLNVVALIALIVILLVALIPQLISSITGFFSNISTYTESLQKWISSLGISANEHNVDISGITSAGNDLLGRLTSYLSKNADSVIDTSFSIGMNVVNGFISFIIAIYFLASKDHVLGGCKRLMSVIFTNENTLNSILKFLRRCNSILIQYIACDLLDGMIIGLANLVFFKILGMPYSVLISVVCGVTNLAPTFGPILGGIIGAFILVLVNPWYALWFIIFTLILQTIDGYVIKPVLFGGQLGVSSVWILVSIIVFGRMFGVVGILLAIPFAAIIDFMYHDFIKERMAHIKENKNKKSKVAQAAATVRDTFAEVTGMTSEEDPIPEEKVSEENQKKPEETKS